jgi:hypothetical protein
VKSIELFKALPRTDVCVTNGINIADDMVRRVMHEGCMEHLSSSAIFARSMIVPTRGHEEVRGVYIRSRAMTGRKPPTRYCATGLGPPEK